VLDGRSWPRSVKRYSARRSKRSLRATRKRHWPTTPGEQVLPALAVHDQLHLEFCGSRNAALWLPRHNRFVLDRQANELLAPPSHHSVEAG
jgi:hypothetical protein